MSHHGTVITEAATDVQNLFASSKLKCIDARRYGARRSIEQLARRVDRNRGVLVHMPRIRIGGLPPAEIVAYVPRTWAEKALAGHSCQRFHKGCRTELAGGLYLAGIFPSDGLEAKHRASPEMIRMLQREGWAVKDAMVNPIATSVSH
jgi:esterase/lipase